MQLTDVRDIAASPEVVWAAILDADVLKECLAGCESMSGSPEAGFEAAVVQKVGPVKARFTGVVSLTDMVPPRSLTLSGEGKGGAAGFAKGSARVTMEPIEIGTRLSYTVEAHVGGKLAQLGSRIIDGFAKKMADDFFTRFQAAVEAPDADDVPDEKLARSTEKKKGWFKRIIGG